MNRSGAVVAALANASEWETTAGTGRGAIPLQNAYPQRVHRMLEALA